MTRLVIASASPARARLLRAAGVLRAHGVLE
jgi:predicted house-cleaning NTP pyrophosphatase (Maf/HAM1 superfamily)